MSDNDIELVVGFGSTEPFHGLDHVGQAKNIPLHDQPLLPETHVEPVSPAEEIQENEKPPCNITDHFRLCLSLVSCSLIS